MGPGAVPGTGVDPRPPLGATGALLKNSTKLELAEKTQLQLSPGRLLKKMWVREVLSQSLDFGTLEKPTAFRML